MGKVHPLVQQELRKLEPDELMTVIVQVADMNSFQAFLARNEREGTTLAYNSAPLFDTIVVSAARQVVESFAEREDVIDIIPNLAIGLPPYRQGNGPTKP